MSALAIATRDQPWPSDSRGIQPSLDRDRAFAVSQHECRAWLEAELDNPAPEDIDRVLARRQREHDRLKEWIIETAHRIVRGEEPQSMDAQARDFAAERAEIEAQAVTATQQAEDQLTASNLPAAELTTALSAARAAVQARKVLALAALDAEADDSA